jgi:hypothetical protein
LLDKRTDWEEASSTVTTYESWLEMGAPSGKWSVMKKWNSKAWSVVKFEGL